MAPTARERQASFGGGSSKKHNPTVKRTADTVTNVENVAQGVEGDAGRAEGLFRRGRHGRLFYRFVRRGIAQGLMEEGYDSRAAWEQAEDVTDEWIDEKADEMHLIKVGALGDGSFLQWLVDNKDKILEFIMAIVSIFLMFAGPKMRGELERVEKANFQARLEKPAEEEKVEDKKEDKPEEAPAPVEKTEGESNMRSRRNKRSDD